MIDYEKTLAQLKACEDRLAQQPAVDQKAAEACKAESDAEKLAAQTLLEQLQNQTKKTELAQQKAEFFEQAYNTCKRRPSLGCRILSKLTLGLWGCK